MSQKFFLSVQSKNTPSIVYLFVARKQVLSHIKKKISSAMDNHKHMQPRDLLKYIYDFFFFNWQKNELHYVTDLFLFLFNWQTNLLHYVTYTRITDVSKNGDRKNNTLHIYFAIEAEFPLLTEKSHKIKKKNRKQKLSLPIWLLFL